VVNWIVANGRDSFTEHEIRQARRWITDEGMDAVLKTLIQCEGIRREPTPAPAKKGGRPPSARYAVNPALAARNP